MLYFVCFFSFLVYLMLSTRNKIKIGANKLTKSKGVLTSLIITIGLIIITSIRWGTGTDFYSYLDLYKYVSQINSLDDFTSSHNHIEVGYKLLVYLSRAFNGEIFYFFINAVLSIGIMYLGLLRLYKIQSYNLVFSLFIFFMVYLINYPFNAMRQAITMAIFIYSIKDMYELKTKKILLLSLFSFLIHSTGLLIFLSYIWYRLLKKHANIYTYICVVFLSVILYNLGLISLLFSMFFPSKVEFFTESWGAVSLSSLAYRYLVVLLMFSLYVQYKSIKVADLLIIIYLFGLIFYTGLSTSDMLAARFNMFFRVLEVIILPLYISNIPTRVNRYCYFALTIILMSLPFFSALEVEDNEYNVNPIFSIN
jgi:hypothetical protein